MKRLLTMALFLAAALALSACGGAEQNSGQSDEEAAPPEPTQAESEAPANGEATTTPEEAPNEEAAPEDGAPSSGPSATTIQGEEVSLGGGGDVTALFFMAGW